MKLSRKSKDFNDHSTTKTYWLPAWTVLLCAWIIAYLASPETQEIYFAWNCTSWGNQNEPHWHGCKTHFPVKALKQMQKEIWKWALVLGFLQYDKIPCLSLYLKYRLNITSKGRTSSFFMMQTIWWHESMLPLSFHYEVTACCKCYVYMWWADYFYFGLTIFIWILGQ